MLICRSTKPKERQNKILFIDAVKEVARERAQSFLKLEHQSKILDAYRTFADQPGFAAVVTNKEVLAQGGNLSIPRHVKKAPATKTAGDAQRLDVAWAAFEEDGREFMD